MAKPGTALPGSAGLAEWLPLLGSICQVLAAMGEGKDSEPGGREDAAGQRLLAGQERD
jgi:hypothetical protein